MQQKGWLDCDGTKDGDAASISALEEGTLVTERRSDFVEGESKLAFCGRTLSHDRSWRAVFLRANDVEVEHGCADGAEDLLETHEDAENADVDAKLQYGGRTLDPTLTLGECGVEPGSTLDMVVAVRGGIDGMTIMAFAILGAIALYLLYKLVLLILKFGRWLWRFILRAQSAGATKICVTAPDLPLWCVHVQGRVARCATAVITTILGRMEIRG